MFSTRHLNASTRWTKEAILEKITEEEIFQTLGLPVEHIGKRFCSPFRKDSNPDCRLILTRETRKLRFYDPALGSSLDWIGLVQYSQELDFQGALNWVAETFFLQKRQFIPTPVANKPLMPFLPTTIQVRYCPFSSKDLTWWAQFNISQDLLVANRVSAISDYWVNGRHHYCPKGLLAFCYKEHDGYKLYFPQEEKRWKWRSTTRALACYELLPQTGSLLVITSSKKDAMCLQSFGYYAIAPQGEGVDIPANLLWELKQRFQRIIIFYDNDYPGLQLAHQKKHFWQVDDYVFLPFTEDAKDPAAYCAAYGADAAKEQFITLLSPC